MPDTPTDAVPTDDDLDAELRLAAHALMADPPPAPPFPVQAGPADSAGAAPAQAPFPAAGGTGGRDGDGRAARSRRPLVAVAAVAAAVVAVVAGVVVATAGDQETPAPLVSAPADPEDAPQRLIVRFPYRELPQAGDPVTLEVVGLDPHGLAPLPGGGHVLVGNHVVTDPPPGFDEFSELEFSLVVVDGDGRVVVDRPVPASELVAADGTVAYLERTPRGRSGRPEGPTELVAHDLASGDERVIHTSEPPEGDLLTIAWSASALVGDDLLTATGSTAFEPTGPEGGGASVPGSQRCGLRRLDLATGEASEAPLGPSCSEVRGMRLSPDGTRVAVVYSPPWDGATDSLPEQRVAIVRVADGAVVRDALLGHDIECDSSCGPEFRPFHFEGVAWQDEATLRLASSTPEGDIETVLVDVG